jgi:hypothetical protein
MIKDSVKMGNDTMFDNVILDHQILITIALLRPDARYEVSSILCNVRGTFLFKPMIIFCYNII